MKKQANALRTREDELGTLIARMQIEKAKPVSE